MWVKSLCFKTHCIPSLVIHHLYLLKSKVSSWLETVAPGPLINIFRARRQSSAFTWRQFFNLNFKMWRQRCMPLCTNSWTWQWNQAKSWLLGLTWASLWRNGRNILPCEVSRFDLRLGILCWCISWVSARPPGPVTHPLWNVTPDYSRGTAAPSASGWSGVCTGRQSSFRESSTVREMDAEKKDVCESACEEISEQWEWCKIVNLESHVWK